MTRRLTAIPSVQLLVVPGDAGPMVDDARDRPTARMLRMTTLDLS